MPRADFTSAVKEALARRTQFRCSFPGCNSITVGPSEESSEKTSNSGMACHIVAASGGAGARRVDATMSSDLRESIDNGIWMCYTHGKLIDTDEATYTVAMLQRWKQLAELRAKLSQQVGRTVDLSSTVSESIPLAESELVINSLGGENELIGKTLLNSCIGDIWGKDIAAAVRDIAIELVRNAFTHGAATTFKISIQTNKITITDNGGAFLYSSLCANPNGRGGAAALKQLHNYSDNILLSSRRTSSENETVIAFIKTPDEIAQVTPCTVRFNSTELHGKGFRIPVLSGCDSTYIVMPMFISFSDAFKIIGLLKHRAQQGERFVIVTHHTSEGVKDELKKGLPGSRIMIL